VCKIDTSRYIDNLIEESYTRSSLLRDIRKSITDLDCCR
jgi:hypothetical protein